MFSWKLIVFKDLILIKVIILCMFKEIFNSNFIIMDFYILWFRKILI